MYRSSRSRMLVTVLSGLGLGWAAPSATAQVVTTLYTATFDAPTYTDGPLNFEHRYIDSGARRLADFECRWG